MNNKKSALGTKAYPLGMLIVGLLFMPLGIFRFPGFIVVSLLYLFIGMRGLSAPVGRKSKKKADDRSDKTQLESL